MTGTASHSARFVQVVVTDPGFSVLMAAPSNQ